MTLPKYIVEQIEKEAIKYCVSQPPNFSGESHEVEAYIAGATKYAEQVEMMEKIINEEFLLEVITEWKHSWMDVKGTDERDRKNYFHRAFGVDANMKYSLARMIIEKLKAMREKNGRGE